MISVFNRRRWGRLSPQRPWYDCGPVRSVTIGPRLALSAGGLTLAVSPTGRLSTALRDMQEALKARVVMLTEGGGPAPSAEETGQLIDRAVKQAHSEYGADGCSGRRPPHVRYRHNYDINNDNYQYQQQQSSIHRHN